jgi:hypothetical protein
VSNNNTKTNNQNRDTRVIAGIDRHFANVAKLTIGGTDYTPASLKAVFQTDSNSIDRVVSTRQAWRQAVVDEREAHVVTARVAKALKSYIIGLYGQNAVAVLGDFGLTPPKTATKPVKVKAKAADLAQATREARNTMGSQQKKKVKGTLPEEGTTTPKTKTGGGTPPKSTSGGGSAT